MSEPVPEPANDRIIYGAENIALYLFSDRNKRRRIYYLNSATCFPSFRLGARICVRVAVLEKWIASQEGKKSLKS